MLHDEPFEEFNPPAPQESDDYTPRENYGHSCIVKVREFRADVATVNGSADAVYADVYDLQLGSVARNVMLMGGAFVDAFKPYVGKGPLVIEWEKRTSRAGRPYAAPKPATPDAIVKAKAVMAAGDPFVETLSTIDAEPPF